MNETLRLIQEIEELLDMVLSGEVELRREREGVYVFDLPQGYYIVDREKGGEIRTDRKLRTIHTIR